MLNMTKDNRAVEVWDPLFCLISVKTTNKTTCQSAFALWLMTHYNTITLGYDLMQWNKCYDLPHPLWSWTDNTLLKCRSKNSIYRLGSINNALQALRVKRRGGYKYETYELYWQGLAKLAPVTRRARTETADKCPLTSLPFIGFWEVAFIQCTYSEGETCPCWALAEYRLP